MSWFQSDIFYYVARGFRENSDEVHESDELSESDKRSPTVVGCSGRSHERNYSCLINVEPDGG